MQTTVLNAIHHRLGARMVDFGGWEMPLHYGSQIEEHHAVRRDCGLFDVSHMCTVDLLGPDARAFLRRLLANNVDKLTQPGKAFYSVMLNEDGGVVDDLIVYFLGERHFRIVVNAGTTQKDLAWMRRWAQAWHLDVEARRRMDLAMLAIQGPNAREKTWQALPDLRGMSEDMGYFFGALRDDVFIARTGYTGEDGFELTLPAARAESAWQALMHAGAAPCGLGARDTLRLEAGMNLYGQDMDDTTSPLDSGLGWTVDVATARDFIGKIVLQGQGQRRQLLGVVLLGPGVLRAHQKVDAQQGEGEITSGTFSPTMQQAIGFARLPMGVSFGNTVRVEIRGKQHAAKVVRMPFVRHGKVLVNF